MPTSKKPNGTAKPAAPVNKKRAAAQVQDDDVQGDSPYQRAKEAHGNRMGDEFYTYLREHRLDDTSLCLGYYLQRAQREQNLNQADVAERTRTKNEPPITRSFLSAILGGRSGIRADTWVRIADALDANPLEFFIAEGWIDPAHISAYSVPSAHLMMPIAGKLEQIRPEYQQAAITMVGAVLDTIMMQQNTALTPAMPPVKSA